MPLCLTRTALDPTPAVCGERPASNGEDEDEDEEVDDEGNAIVRNVGSLPSVPASHPKRVESLLLKQFVISVSSSEIRLRDSRSAEVWQPRTSKRDAPFSAVSVGVFSSSPSVPYTADSTLLTHTAYSSSGHDNRTFMKSCPQRSDQVTSGSFEGYSPPPPAPFLCCIFHFIFCKLQ